MKIKIPTYEDYCNHTGLHYSKLWNSINDEWTCPACGRSKFQIMRWTKRKPNSTNQFMDWVATLNIHHDHSVGFRENGVRRFSETLICAQCNLADGRAKKKLNLPSQFSFSPQELRAFIKATPHAPHSIDYNLALSIYNSLFSDNTF
ncbi:hypothetical protein R4646_02145 [Acinetobacter baumannii]|nr:hypothetical protein [Acinetobacter baumannii]